jgi:F420-non-reducing hydrogenase small subunit
MSSRPRVAVNWAGACGGCDIALLDSEHRLLELAELVDIVYWPVAMDWKREDLARYGPGEIDVGIFNGAIRTTEHSEDARLLRDRCRVLVAFGTCAALGGIPGLANMYSNRELLETVYRDTPSTDNPSDTMPHPSSASDGAQLELPGLEPRVRALHQVVSVDLSVPGCPPPAETVGAFLDVLVRYSGNGELPDAGTVLASDRALCDSCPRADTRTDRRMETVHRQHDFAADPQLCFHEQGLVCLGMATRGGCGATCILANAPCRGCFGPTPDMLDPGAEALSAVGSIAGFEHEDELPPMRRLAPVRAIPDLAGTFYRFTLAAATIPGWIDDRPKEEE